MATRRRRFQLNARPGASSELLPSDTEPGAAPPPSEPPEPSPLAEDVAAPAAATHLDVIVLTDLRFPGGTSTSLEQEIVAATNGGYTVGVLHMASPRLGSSAVVHRALRGLLDDGTARLVLPGEPVRAPLTIVKHPLVLADPLDAPLAVDTDTVIVVAGQVPADEAATYYDPSAVDANITHALGHRPTWAPVSVTVRASLGDVTLSSEDWSEVIDVDAWHRTVTPSNDRLVIGRHSRPDRLKWPGDAAQLCAVYPVDGSVSVRVLGGADAVADVIGEVPAAWEVLPFGAIGAREFLAGLDAFVYYHHRDLTEAFGRTVLEALAVGLPVVVPPHFAAVFGDACIYAEPEAALDTLRGLLADIDALDDYLARAEHLVRTRFGHDVHRARIEQLIGPPAFVDGPPAVAVPSLDLAPAALRTSYTTTLIACLGASRDEVEVLLHALDAHRRHAPGFIPIVVTTVSRPPRAAQLGIETKVITSRRNWDDPTEEWADYAQRRLRQLAAHYRVDDVVAADPHHPDAWLALQLRRPSRP